jgi:hypothetical protein
MLLYAIGRLDTDSVIVVGGRKVGVKKVRGEKEAAVPSQGKSSIPPPPLSAGLAALVCKPGHTVSRIPSSGQEGFTHIFRRSTKTCCLH